MLDCKVDIGALFPRVVEDDLITSYHTFIMDKSYISISKQESENFESTPSRKNTTYVGVRRSQDYQINTHHSNCKQL